MHGTALRSFDRAAAVMQLKRIPGAGEIVQSADRDLLIIRAPPERPAERRYVLDTVVGEWLGHEYRLITDGQARRVTALRLEGSDAEVTLPDVLFQTDADRWLQPSSLPQMPLSILDPEVGTGQQAALPVLYGSSSGRAEATDNPSVDILGSIFFLLSRYEEIAAPVADRHGRFPSSASIAARAGFLERPIADEYAELLRKALRARWPRIKETARPATLRPTHDVDLMFGARPDRPLSAIRSLVGDVVRRRDPDLAWRRLRATAAGALRGSGADPFDTFDALMETSERYGLRSTFYVMAERSRGPYRPDYGPSDPRLRSVLSRIAERGHEVGLHAGYESHLSSAELRSQLDDLNGQLSLANTGPTSAVRQHFLRFKAPETWRAQAAAGITVDSSLGYADAIGFRAGTAREFPVFDASQAQRLPLRERPLLIMDGTLFDYLGLEPKLATRRSAALIRLAARHGGDPVILYHNHTIAGRRMARHYAELVATGVAAASTG